MKLFLILSFLFGSTLSALDIAQAWKEAQKASAQTKINAAERALQSIKKMIKDLEKMITERPSLGDSETACAQKKLFHLLQLLELLESSQKTLQTALESNNNNRAALEYGKMKGFQEKAEKLFKDSIFCFMDLSPGYLPEEIELQDNSMIPDNSLPKTPPSTTLAEAPSPTSPTEAPGAEPASLSQ